MVNKVQAYIVLGTPSGGQQGESGGWRMEPGEQGDVMYSAETETQEAWLTDHTVCAAAAASSRGLSLGLQGVKSTGRE